VSENGWGSPFTDIADDSMEERSPNLIGGGDVLSLFSRWDFRILNEEALMKAARKASRDLWPTDSEQAIRDRIDSLASAASEILHESPLAPFSGVGCLEELLNRSIVVVHSGEADTEHDLLRLAYSHLTGQTPHPFE